MAECDFRGRHYIAWYSEEIPVADGPWKFGGLPGFILEVYDTDSYYRFTLVEVNSKATRPVTMPDVQYNRTNTDPAGHMRDVSGASVVITSPDGTTLGWRAALLYLVIYLRISVFSP
jgi:hypothetical protein